MRFTIRDLLWLTLLAAVLAAWWVDHQRLHPKRRPIPGLGNYSGWQLWESPDAQPPAPIRSTR
ncbi:MAG TPA: hypothetical protein VMP01_29210 [Pirellulaceae bacterium]|nr:hypothetical protein [Pirellulaceae bacterium]